jgi:predicted glycosyltransferase involved in capsule biosynthesis
MTLFHSIVIPSRNRNQQLLLAIWSIKRSAAFCGIKNYEIVIVDSHSANPPKSESNVSVLFDTNPKGLLNKPRCQNIGIDSAVGNALTFLDADALVSLRWMEGISELEKHPRLTRLCYRVRYLPSDYIAAVQSSESRERTVDKLFAEYDTYLLAHEAYGRPENNRHSCGPIFGNSQFSMRRDVLGDLRYDDEYVGRGHEDLAFIRETWMRDPESYRAKILTDPEHAIFHFANSLGGPDWRNKNQAARNERRYYNTWNGKQRLLPISKK